MANPYNTPFIETEGKKPFNCRDCRKRVSEGHRMVFDNRPKVPARLCLACGKKLMDAIPADAPNMTQVESRLQSIEALLKSLVEGQAAAAKQICEAMGGITPAKPGFIEAYQQRMAAAAAPLDTREDFTPAPPLSLKSPFA